MIGASPASAADQGNGRRKPGDFSRDRLLSRVCLGGLIAVFGYLFIYHYHHESRGDGLHLGDFPTFYIAAEYARDHRDIYTAGTSAAMMYVYPPLIAFLYTPLTALSIRQAAKVALLLNTLMLLGSVLLSSRMMLQRMGVNQAMIFWPVALLVSLLSINELRAVLTMLETDPIMLLMFVLGLYYLDRRPAWAGLALALAFNVKYLSIVALPYLLLRRRWTAAVAMMAGAILFALLPAVQLGWHEDLRCLRVAMGGLLRWVGVLPVVSHSIKVHDIGDDLSVSVTSAIARVLRPHGFTNPEVMVIAAAVGLMSLAIAAGMYHANGFPLWRWPVSQKQQTQPFKGLMSLEWAGLAAAALIFSPDTNTRHLVLTVIVNALAAVLLLSPGRSISRWPALLATSLILFCYIMPFGSKDTPIHFFYFKYSFPGCGLLIGYLLLLRVGLHELQPAV